jgi:hypothetical protein
MTRFEAAALLNACLDRVTEVTDELKRLMKEFEQELAILKGRVDGLEARVGELEATQFSTTTKLKGQATFVVGANSFAGDATDGAGVKRADAAAAQSGATTFNYDLKLFLDTSFTGRDLLRTVLRSGNFANSAFSGNGYVGLDSLEVAFEEDSGPNSVGVNRLFYQFPIGDSFTATVGGLVRQDDMLAVWPSAYPADTVLDFFTYAGAPGAYNLTLGQGAGLSWESDDFSVSANYLSNNGSNSNPGSGNNACGATSGGIANACSGNNGTVQVAYAPENWGLAAAYNYASTDNNGVGLYAGNGTPAAVGFQAFGPTNSAGLSAWWTPEESGLIPSISTGWGISTTDAKDSATGVGANVKGSTSQSWYVGLQWADAFIEGNTLGMAVGQPTFVTSVDWKSSYTGDKYVGDEGYAWEWWYQFQVTDNISVTPAIYYLSRPLGSTTGGLDANGIPEGGSNRSESFTNFGGLIKTTFKF